ncbi:MAG: hypothetical protein HYV09_39255 [Deltaproteobacteria bacterium]|nr:hypothetical protein [Deltaproteobacteria bacterium]
MSRHDDLPSSSQPQQRAVPRAVIRLLRSGQLDEAKTRRVLEIHGPVALEAVGSVKPEAPEA